MTATEGWRIAAWAAHVPGWTGTPLGWDPGSACPAEEAGGLLGRRGLRYKTSATRLALSAAARALGATPIPPGPARDPSTAVVVAGNLGVIEAVGAVCADLAAGGAAEVSIMQAPNISANVVASTIAIRFGFAGPNLLVTSGRAAGLDAVGLAQLLLASGRADRVLVVGVEPADPLSGRLLAAASGTAGRPARAAAAAVLLAGPATEGLRIGPVAVTTADEEPSAGLDLEPELGDTHGALGVLQVAVAAGALAGGTATGPLRVRCGGTDGGWRRAEVRR